MARDTAVPDDGELSGKSGSNGDLRNNNTLLDRRSYLKLAGATAAAATTATGAASAAGDDYDVITANNQVIRLGNETWENKLIDCRNGRGITIVPEGPATIRNVGLKGLYRGGSFIFSITSTTGTVTFDNVYLGDGANKDGESFVHGPGAVFYHRSANCRVEFKRMNVQGFPNNGFYCSNTKHGGSVHWDTCFGKNNGVTTFRSGSGRDTIVNCTAYNDNTNYGTSNGSYGGYMETDGRPLWHWGSQTVRPKDCNFAAGTYGAAIITHEGGRVVMDGGNVSGGTQGNVNTSSAGSNVDRSIPDGVPRSAEEAASGGSAGSSEPSIDPWTEAHDVEYIYEVENTSDEPVDYYLQVSDGTFEHLDYEGAVVDEELTWYDGDKAAGRVAPGDTHCWGMNEWLVDVTIEDAANAEARVNENESSLGWYPQDGADGDGWKDLDELLGLADDTDEDEAEDDEYEAFSYEVEAHEDDVEYFLEAKEGADFTPLQDSERIYVSDDGTRAAGLLESGETHGFEGTNVDAPAMLDVTIRGDGTGYVDGNESSLGWYPQDGASGDDWKDLDELLDLTGEFSYEVEAHEDDVEYFLEAKEGADFTALVDSEFVYVSDDGTRAAGLLESGESHEFTGTNVDAPAMLDVTIRGDGTGYINDSESSLGWYPQEGASGDGWKDLDELLDLTEEFTYEVEAHEDGVEYFLEAKEGADFTPLDDAELIYVSDDGTRAAGRLESGETHGFEGTNVDAPAMLDVTIRGDGTGYVNGNESSLGWYPQKGASGDGWKDLDELLD